VDGTSLSVDEEFIPTEFALHQNYPNPFNPVTTLNYGLPEQSMVVMTVYDLMGREVTTLVNQVQKAGYHTIRWNGTDQSGQVVSAGLYIYRITAGDYSVARKMILLK
jgi:flagellar hook assembly protein FlgD